ncbi:MAG: SRPBCC domain-containing protein [Alphaproteobacteria bacterium]
MSARADARQPADDELLIVRTFDAPIALVFRVWEQREHMIRWWGPRDFTCTALDVDFRPGGAWRACIVSDAYGETWMSGAFREIVRDRRIVFTFAWEGGDQQPGVETLVTVTFEERDGKTTQTFHQAPFVSVETRDSHVSGWNECFDREQSYAEHLAPAGQA